VAWSETFSACVHSCRNSTRLAFIAVKMWLLIAFIVIVVLYIILGFICGFDFGKCGNDKK